MKTKASLTSDLAAARISVAPFNLLYTGAQRKNGMTLVLVLGLVALCTILVVAFLTLMSSELVSSKAASNETTATQLATTAVQLVQGTIIHATEPRTSAGVPDTGQAWACQPGMIRTYGTANPGSQTTASSAPLAYYKLYSATNMIVSTPTSYNVDGDIVQNWDTAPSIFTDLNAPIYAGTASEIFPIVDPRAVDSDIAVQGFDYSGTATMSGTVVNGVVKAGGASTSDTTSRLPMPVRWLYVLQDGTMVAPGGTSSAVLTSAGGAQSSTGLYPTATNAIVGRVAFWTDDESSKVNINTASEGTYTDTPVTLTRPTSPVASSFGATNSVLGDLDLAVFQGAQYEYQRYPGHPATTCLSTVFGNYLTTAYPGITRAQLVQAITDAVPRITEAAPVGGVPVSSLGGTQESATNLFTGTLPQVLDHDRLYANVDEFNFLSPAIQGGPTTTRNQQFGSGSGAGVSLGLSSTQTTALVDKCRFFLTANSKAPELNLFGLPRVAIWPIWSDNFASSRTTWDNEMLRCATVYTNGAVSSKSHPFIFSRYDSTSPVNDWSASTGGVANRNQQIYGYLQALTSRAVPGYGGIFNAAAKYGNADRDQILTEIFDYIRATNLEDLSTNSFTHTVGVPYTGQFSTASANLGVVPTSSMAKGNAPGQVVPIQITAPTTSTVTQGFGRFPLLGEIALILTKVDDRKSTSAGESGNLATTVNVNGWPSITSFKPATQTLFEWTLIPKLESPMAGYMGLAMCARFEVKNVNLTFKDAGGNTVVTTPATGTATVSNNYTTNGPPANTSGPISEGTANVLTDVYDGPSGVGRMANNTRESVIGGNMGYTEVGDGNAPSDSMYPTGLVLCNALTAGGTLSITGTFDVEAHASAGTSDATAGPVIQTYHFSFPATMANGQPMKTPVPGLAFSNGSTTSWAGTFRATSSAYTQGATATFAYPAAGNGGTAAKNLGRINGGGSVLYFLWPQDVGRSLIAAGTMLDAGGNSFPIQGDLRLIASAPVIPATAFVVAPKSVTGGSQVNVPGSPYVNNYGNLPTQSDQYVVFLRSALQENYNTTTSSSDLGGLFSSASGMTNYGAEVPPTIAPAYEANKSAILNIQGDWDTGPGQMVDGPWLNKTDDGVSAASFQAGGGGSSYHKGWDIPYMGFYQDFCNSAIAAPTLFAPNRQISSPVMFGSLPAGRSNSWRTLLFRPAKLLNSAHPHPGASSDGTTFDGTIPDHLFLDLFWMPVVEPYGISEPLATAGKVNLNYQIAPFTYITRKTGMEAILKPVMVTAIPQSIQLTGFNYKTSLENGQTSFGPTPFNNATRYGIDPIATLSQFDARFVSTATPSAATPNFFVSASDICDVPLIPTGSTVANVTSTFWANNQLTGDNELERPYSLIYPRVTTQSNVFTVHVKSQSLKQVPADLGAGSWTEGTDLVTGEYRGSFVIEKYFDPDNANITASDGSATLASDDSTLSRGQSVRGAKWRILSNKRFGQ